MTCLSPSKVTVGAGWSRPMRFDKAPFFKIKVACSFVSVKIIFIIKSLSAAFSPFIWIASKSNSISGLRFWAQPAGRLRAGDGGRGGGAHGADHAAGAGGEDTMITQNRGTIAFAVCGSFCTLEAALQSARALTAQGWQLLPVMSFAARQDTRFGTGNYWKEQLEAAAGHPVLDTLQAVEPLGPRKMAQALVVAPCTGATLSRLAAGLSDTPVTLAAKSLLRVGCPVVLAVSTNDGLGASGENIARLFQRKHYYFVPYGQDDPAAKPQSLKADFARLPAALEAALHGEQLQPVLLGQRERAMAFQPGQNVVY